MNGSESDPLMPESHDNHQHVRRVVLPSGKTIEVVYFEDQGVPMPEQLKRAVDHQTDLHVCTTCRSVWWSTARRSCSGIGTPWSS